MLTVNYVDAQKPPIIQKRQMPKGAIKQRAYNFSRDEKARWIDVRPTETRFEVALTRFIQAKSGNHHNTLLCFANNNESSVNIIAFFRVNLLQRNIWFIIHLLQREWAKIWGQLCEMNSQLFPLIAHIVITPLNHETNL